MRASRLTDAELIYAPSQIALAALSLAAPDLATAWAQSKAAEPSLSAVETIKTMITRDGVGPDVERVRDVDRRLKLCKNPEKVIGSAAYLAKKEAEEKKDKERRERKAGIVKQSMDGGDPFGEVLSSRDNSFDDDDDDD